MNVKNPKKYHAYEKDLILLHSPMKIVDFKKLLSMFQLLRETKL